jgi:hypothetical protein
MVTVQSEDVGKISKRERRRRRPGAGWDCGGGQGGIKYKCNGLNALKPDMITEATRKCEVVGGQVCGGFGEPGEVDQVGESRECFDLGCGQYFDGR